MSTATTYLVIRNGEIKLRLQGARVVDGKLRVPHGGKLMYLVDGELAKAEGRDDVLTLAKAGRHEEIDPRYLAGPGESPSGLVVIEAEAYNRQQRAAAAAKVLAPVLVLSGRGELVLEVDARDEAIGAGSVVTLLGYRWEVTRLGKVFSRGGREARYAYVARQGVDRDSDLRAAYRELLALDNEEQRRSQRAFDRMMSDERNDGAAPPRAYSRAYRELAEALAAEDEMAPLAARAEAQAEESAETTAGYSRSRAARRALALLRAGASKEAVEVALESYREDPDYIEASWR